MKKILIIGATSAIAQATARLWAAQGDMLVVMGRDRERLDVIAADLVVRGAKSADVVTLDANDFAQHEKAIGVAWGVMQGIDVALIAHGVLPDQKACEADVALARAAFDTNALSVIALATHLANRFEAQRAGTIAVIGSVAGDRGRASNYVYGTAKAAVATFLQGLRNRLHASGVNVLTIKPGFVDTPMTASIERKGPLWATPERVAQGIVAAVDRRADVVYLPWFWRWIMLVIRLIPESIFKGMHL